MHDNYKFCENAAKAVSATLSKRPGWFSTQIMTLGGESRASLIITVSLDARETWNNGILENSRYAKFYLGTTDNKLEMISGHGGAKFRKCSVKTPEELAIKIDSWVCKSL